MEEDTELPLLCRTPAAWAELAAQEIGDFLADHAVCEQAAALAALNLVAHYPEDAELVDRMSALAAEEVSHLRRVVRLLRRRGRSPAPRRSNPYVQGLHSRLRGDREPRRKIDRLIVGALIEARSCERFTRLLEVLAEREPDVARLLADLGPAEKRHWEIFHALAAREAEPTWFDEHWRGWLEHERSVIEPLGVAPTVHG